MFARAGCRRWLVCAIAAAGCSSQTRTPSILPTRSEGDKRSFNVHDPLPEKDIGPEMGIRPGGFENDRAEPRRTRDAQQSLGVLPHGGIARGSPADPAARGGTLGGPTSQAYP